MIKNPSDRGKSTILELASCAPMTVEEKADAVLRPDAAVPEAIGERWRTHRRRGLCACSVPMVFVRVGECRDPPG
jgi:hypothetical protein